MRLNNTTCFPKDTAFILFSFPVSFKKLAMENRGVMLRLFADPMQERRFLLAGWTLAMQRATGSVERRESCPIPLSSMGSRGTWDGGIATAAAKFLGLWIGIVTVKLQAPGAHTDTHAHAHAHTHTCIHTHAHSLSLSLSPSFSLSLTISLFLSL